MEVDLRVGSAFTRFLTDKLQNRFSGLDQRVISYGPCQFPTLGFVVRQFWKIKNFVSEKFWFIKMAIQHENQQIVFNWKRRKLFDHAIAFVIFEMLFDNPTASIISVERKPVTKYKPLPLTTVELQKLSAIYLKISSKKTMDVFGKIITTKNIKLQTL
ncbi:DNA topoisomerase [Bonamia ostreae]|uniref:DNA topoisomerase n=1 Tax=Bonamia ostreae TaxID=126728 RepID=A0ABV2AR16_9EUKA